MAIKHAVERGGTRPVKKIGTSGTTKGSVVELSSKVEVPHAHVLDFPACFLPTFAWGQLGFGLLIGTGGGPFSNCPAPQPTPAHPHEMAFARLFAAVMYRIQLT